jgi:hypothetical protein
LSRKWLHFTLKLKTKLSAADWGCKTKRDMNTKLLTPFRAVASANGKHLTMLALIDRWQQGQCDIGEMVWDKCHSRHEMVAICGDWPGWPKCQCGCCGCEEPATCTDDSGTEVCDDCQEYTTDDEGNVICSRDERVEIVTEPCGAGNQTRSYVRIKPPEMPETDADGQYALYWETVGSDAHVVERFSTIADAVQAVAAKDWPRPGDNTNYLCRYGVRQLIDGEWVGVPGAE